MWPAKATTLPMCSSIQAGGSVTLAAARRSRFARIASMSLIAWRWIAVPNALR